MLPLSYTDTDAIRAALGVTEKDVSDAQLAGRSLEKELNLDLMSWVSNHETIAETADFGTAANLALFDAISLYSTYFCAKIVLTSLQLAALQSVSDGKNAMSRFAPIDWDKLYDRISERVAFYRTFILENNLALTTTTTKLTQFSIVGSAYDPVTGV